ncbi:MAG: LysR family transcriptional regulator [Bdellovibrionota bacterium]
MEATLGVRLMDRDRRWRARLTEAGARLFDGALDLQTRFRALESDALDLSARPQVGRLSIGASDNVAHYLLPRFLKEAYCPRMGITKISVFVGTSSEIENELKLGRVDLGIFHSAPVMPTLKSRVIAKVRFKIVGKAGYAPRDGDGYVLPRAMDYVGPYPVRKMLLQAGLNPRVDCEANSQELQKRFALNAHGLAVLPSYMVAEELKANLLVERKTKVKLEYPLHLARTSFLTPTRSARAFMELFPEWLATPTVFFRGD